MTRLLAAIAALALAVPASAESLVATRAILAKTVVGVGDFRPAKAVIPGAITDPADAEGMEARVTIYEGRPIRAGDLIPPALVERNEIVRLRFSSGTLLIATEGRALDRGALGDRVRVMNLSSRSVVTGSVAGIGDVIVSR